MAPIAWRPRWRGDWIACRGGSSGSKGTSAFPMRRWRCSSDFGSPARGHCRTRPWRPLKMDKGAPDRADHRPEVSVPGPVSRTIATDSSGLGLQRSGGTGSPGHGQRRNEADAKGERVRGPGSPGRLTCKNRPHPRGEMSMLNWLGDLSFLTIAGPVYARFRQDRATAGFRWP